MRLSFKFAGINKVLWNTVMPVCALSTAALNYSGRVGERGTM